MNLKTECPDCHATLSAHIFDLGPLDDKAKDWIAELILEEHRDVCPEQAADARR